MHDFGSFLKEQRKKRGWTQAELARRVGVGQQTVGGWETSASKPRGEDLESLARVLEVDRNLLIARRTGTHRLKKTGLVNLPLAELTPEEFEQFSADLAHLLYPGKRVTQYGERGHKQNGIDIEVHDGEQMFATFQCKRHQSFGPAKVRAAIKAAVIDTPSHHILLTRPASPGAIDEIKKHAGWQLWDVADIARKIRYDLPLDKAMRLIDTFFPGRREAFLGVRDPGPWLIVSEFSQQLTAGKVFNHNNEMVGRQEVMEDIRRFVAKDDEWLAAVVGRGGLGKTRLIKEAVLSVDETDMEVRVLNTNKEVSAESFELLPDNTPLLVVIDDVHERSDTAELIAAIKNRVPQAKILLSLRPYGMPQLTYNLRRIGIDSTEISVFTLEDLKHGEAMELVEQILPSHQYGQPIVRRLAAISTDCPLIAVVGAGLIKQGTLRPTDLDKDEGIRNRILTAFKDALVAEPVSGDPKLREKVLKAVALLQPVNLQDKDGEFEKALVELVGVDMDDILPYMNGLEDAGVFLRRGQSFRIVPDLLGDAVLTDACFDSRSGRTKSYIEGARKSLSGMPLQNIFVNASRVDWRIKLERGATTSLVESLWDDLDEELKTAKIGVRRQLMKLVQKIAYFQPDRALRVVKYIIENPTDELEKTDDILARIYPATYSDVLRELPPILKNIAYNYDFLRPALTQLWELAKIDSRPTNQYPDHALRVLTDLAGYETGKPVLFNETIFEEATNWFGALENGAHYSPFDVLSPLLATEGSDSYSEGISLSFRPYAVRVEAVKKLRSRVIELALEEATSPDLGRAVRAITFIGEGISYPSGLFGRVVPDEERDSWTPVFVEEIDRLKGIAINEDLDPVVGIAIRRALQWHTDFSKLGTKEVARATVAAIPDDDIHHLALVLFDGWGRLLFERIRNYEVAQKRQNEHFDEFAAKLLGKYSVVKLVNLLEKLMHAQADAFGGEYANPGAFVWNLMRKEPEVGFAICNTLKSNPNSALLPVTSVVVSCLVAIAPDRAVQVARNLVSCNDNALSLRVAHAFGWSRGSRSELVEGEIDLIRDFAGDPDPRVRATAIRAAQVIAEVDQLEAISILEHIELSDDKGLAEQYIGTFGTHGQLVFADLPPDLQARVWDFLETCESLGDYHFTDFLTHVAKDAPDKIIAMLLRRIEIDERLSAERKDDEEYNPRDYHAIPYNLKGAFEMRHHPQFVGLLRQVKDWIAKEPKKSWQRFRYGSEVFRIVTGGQYDDRVVEVLNDAMNDGGANQFYALTSILHDLPRSVVWNNIELVTRILHAAEKLGGDHFKNASSALHSTVISGSRSGIPGQPFPEDIEQRDNAARIAAGLPYGSIEQKFYQSLERSALESIKWHMEGDEKLLDNRDW